MKKSYIKLIKFSTILFVFGFIFFTYTNSVEAAVRTWTGASDDLWSNPANWGGVVPVSGDDLVFPGGAGNLSNENDLTENTIFNSITFSDDGYTLSGNTIILGPGLAGITDISSSGGNTIALNIQLNATRDIFVTNVNESLTISGRITGIGGITKEGLGKLILSGGNTYGGVTKINVGVVSAQHDRALGTIALGTEVVGNASLELQGGINISYEALALRGWGVDGAGALRNISGNNTYGGLITMIAGGAKIVSDSGTLTLTGGTSGSIPIVFDGAGNITFSKTPISGSATVTKNGAGTLTYNFPNTYTGLTTINAGTLLYGVDNAILTSAITVTGGTLDIATYSDIVGVVTLGTLDLASGTITGSTGVLSSTGFTVYNGIISAIIAGNAAALTKSTPGIVTLTRPNQFTGTTTVSAGILKIQDSLALGVIDGITTVSAGATLQIDGDGLSIPEYITFSGTGHLYNGAIQNINGDNTITGLLTMASAGTLDSEVGTTLTIDSRGISATTLGLTFNADGDFVFTSTAPIYGTTAALVKNGAGSVTLGAFNNFTGATNINSGSIILSGSGAITRSVTMTINTGGRLVIDNENGGTDRLADTLAVTMNGGSIDFYGSSVGDVFATSGALTISSGQNIINVHPSSGGATVLRFASLTRAASASALFRGVDFGDTPGAGVSTLLFTTSPALVGDDGAPGTPTLSILQGVFGDNSMSGNGADMVTYARGGIGVRLLNRAGFSNEYTNDLTITNANVKLTASTPAFTSMINSLILDSSAEITNPDNSEVITLTSGNIVNLVTDTNIGGANTTLAAGSIDFSLRTIENLTISANLSTTGGITKSGSNTLTFSTPQSYTGTTDINRGTLKYGVDNVISNGAVNINSGTLDIDQYDDTVGVVTLNDGTITGTTGVLTGTSYSVRDGTISAIIGGSGTLTKVTTATSVRSTVLLTRDNTYTGVTAISGGILKIGSAGDGTNTPLGTTAGGTTIANVGALDLNGFTLSTDETITSMGSLGFGAGSSVANGNSNMGALMNSSPTSVTYSGDIVLAATSRINADYGAVTISGNISGNQLLTLGGYSDITFSGVKSGTSGITKDGIGTLTLSGNNSYSGATTISVGTVKLGATGSGANTPLGTTAGITTVALGARLDLNGYTLSTAQALTLNGVGYGLGDFASGALMNSSGSSVTYSGLLTLGSTGPLIRADFGDINLTAAGTITGAAFALTLGGSSNGTLASVIGTTTGTVTKIGTGMWTLSGNSTYTGATTVNMGTLRLGGAGSGLNTPLGVIAAGTTVTNGAVLDLNGYTLATAETLAINGRGINDSGALINNSAGAVTYSGAVAQGSDSRITNSGAGLLTFTGAVTGAFALYTGGAGNITHSTGVIGIGTGTLTKQGAGTLTVNSSATYTGITRISGGTLAYGASGLLAATPIVVDGGTWNMGGITDTVGTVTLVGGSITNGTLTATTSYTMESGTVSAVLAGAVAFTKNTNNTVTLTGANTNSSTTTINAGNLILSGSGSAVSSTFTVNLGGTLTLDNSATAVASRLGDALALTLNGGNFNFIGNSAGASSETTGALTLPTGHNTITVTPGAGGSTTMTFASLSRTAGATALFRGTDMRSAAGANVSTLLFTAAPALTGAGGGAGTTTMSVLKGAFGDTSLSGTGSDMVTVISNKLSPLASGEYTGDFQTANANVKLTADRAAVATNTNSLILNGFSVTNPGGAVTLPISSASLSGNILINSANDIAGANTTLGITTTELPILATANSTISATIGTVAAGSVTLSGTGNVTLSAANPYTSTTFINGATLTAGANNVISSGGVTMRGGVYNLNGNSDTVGAISLTGSTITTGAGTLTGNGSFTTATNANYASTISGNLGLGANATFTINDGLMDNDAIISAVISGGFTFAKAGAGVLMLSGSNSYTGATTISAGILRLGAPGGATNTPLGTTAGGTTVTGASSVLDLNGHTLGTTEALTLSGALAAGALQNTSSTDVSYNGQIVLGAASTIIANYGDINITATGNITGNTFGLTIGGAGNGSLASNLNTTTGTLVKNGLGTWTVSGTSSYTGVTTVSAGTFKLGSAGTGTNTPLGTNAGGVSITSGAIFDLNGFTLGTSETATINGTGIANTGAFINSSNNAISYTGATVLGAASRIANYGTGLFTLSGNMSGNFARTMVAVGDIIQSAGVWSGNGNATLVKEGSGTLTLSGQNTTTGAITVSTGILKLGASGGATNTPLGTNAGGVVVSSGAVLDLSTYSLGGASTYETLNLSGTGIKNNGALISEASGNNNFGAMTLSANSKVVNSGSGIINFRGTVTAANSRNFDISGTGPVIISGVYGATATTATITKRDSGSLTISAPSITTGLVRINGGTLAYGVDNALATGAVMIAGGTLDLAGFNETNIGAVTLIDGSIENSGGAATLTSTTTYTAEKGTISAVLGGAAIAFNKNTAGTVTLAAANAFTGATNINAGTLAWGVNDALSSGNLIVTGGVADLGTRTDTVGTVTLTNGAIVSSTGVLTGTSYAVSSGTISAILAGAVNLTKTTTGTVTLSGANTYTGITTISGGTLSVGNIGDGGDPGNLGQASNSAANIVFNTGTGVIQYTGASDSTDRNYTTTNAVTASFDIIYPDTVLVWGGAGTVTTAPVTKAGLGTLKFTQAQGHTGVTSVLAGTLQYGVDDMLSTGAVTVNKGTLDLNNFSDSVGVITLQNYGQIIDSGGTTAVLTTTGTMAAQSGEISARIGGSTATGITKSTSGRVTLSGDNTFTSTAVALSAGYLNLQHNNAFGASGTTLTTTITSGAVLELQGNITLPNTKPVTPVGTGVNNVGAIRNISGVNAIEGNIALGASGVRVNSDSGTLTFPTVSGNARNLIIGGAGDINITGVISTTSGTLTKDGVGVLTLSGANTFTGTTTISGGTILANDTSALGNGSATNTLIFNGGTLKAGGTITSPALRGVTLNQTATIDTNGNNVSFAGVVGSGAGLTKIGTGILSLSGATTLGGDLTISDGTFDQANSLNMTSGSVSVGATGVWSNIGTGAVTLSGDVVNAGTITLNSNNGLQCTNGADSILVRSSVNDTTRAWSGAGIFNLYNLDVDDMTGSVNVYNSTLSGDTTWTIGTCGIVVSGTSNGTGTVKFAIDGVLSGQSAVIGGGTWSASSVEVGSAGQTVTAWIDDVANNAESTAVAKYDGTGAITDMVLDANVLSIGSIDNQSLSIANIGLYGCDEDEDIMYSVISNVLNVEGQSCAGSVDNSYTGEILSTLALNTLAVATGETVTTEKIINTGTITATGSPTLNLAGTSGTLFTNTGTFTPDTSLIDLTGNGDATISSGISTLHNLTISGTGIKTVPADIDIAGTLTVNGGTTSLAEGAGEEGTPTSTSATSPGTVVNDTAVGTLAWPNTSQASSSDDLYSAIASGIPLGYSNYLKATNFGFAIPEGATIDGILLEIERRFNADGPVEDHVVKIVKSDGTLGSVNKGYTSTGWPSNDAYASYPSVNADSDLWGETWSSADINDPDFGAVLQAEIYISDLSTIARVDHMRVTVYYTPVGPADDNLSVGNLAIGASGELTTNDLDITINGNYTNAGAFNAGAGVVIFDASDIGNTLTGTMTGSSKFNNIVFNNADGAWSFGSNSAEVGGNFSVGAGAITAPSTTLTIGGDFINTPETTSSFVHNSGTVVLNSTGISKVVGDTTFNNFTVATGNKKVEFNSGDTFTINGLLTLTGTDTTPIYIDSTEGNNTQWFINHQGTESIAYVTLDNSGCDVASSNVSMGYSSKDGSNNDKDCWIFPVINRGGGGGSAGGEVSAPPGDPEGGGGQGGGGGEGGGEGGGGGGEPEGGGGSGGGGGDTGFLFDKVRFLASALHAVKSFFFF